MSGNVQDNLDGAAGVDVQRVAVTVIALFHLAFVNRVIRHAADAMRQQIAVDIAFDLVAGDAFEVGAVRPHVYVEFTRRVDE